MGYEQLMRVIEADRRQGKTPDLRRIDLAAADLKGFDLSGVDLSGANLSRANLRKVRLVGANLSGADLSHANLRRADLRKARLEEANLTSADLTRANLTQSTLQGANLRSTNLAGANLTGVHLLEAQLRHANLSEDEAKPDWRGFLQHLGPYVMVIGALGIINALTSDYPWFLYPAVGWGIGLSIHFWNSAIRSIPNLSDKWRGLLDHLSAYVSVIGALGIINALTTDYPWFLFPAAGWGIGLAIHLWNALIGGDEEEDLVEDDVESVERVEPPLVRGREAAQAPSGQQPVAGKGLANKTLQLHLDKALAYQDQINRMLQVTADEAIGSRLRDLARQVDEWTGAIEDLARQVDQYQQNTLLQHDLESVPQYIADLEDRLARETNEATRAELQRTLTNRQNQLASLERLKNMMSRAEIQIESTLSALGTIYSQMLTGQSTNHVADYGRLSAEVDEEVRTLQDQLEALEEVKLARG
ncbi:MAG: pentapeptide repeat-containing protein [Anaerolineae bacterium]|nr:pentapeptide repeat-containing protein [Anaerolineae bacterium]